MSSSTYPTLSTTVPLYNILINHIEDTTSAMDKLLTDIELVIKEAAKKYKNKLLKYYNKTNHACLIATILDPRLKI